MIAAGRSGAPIGDPPAGSPRGWPWAALTDDPGLRRVIQVGGFLAGLCWAGLLLIRSPGVPLHDEIAHYLISRNAWHSPLFLLDEWGRAGNTVIYFLPAAVSLTACRLLALALSALTVVFATRLAVQLDARLACLTPLLLWFQPWFAELSFPALTEVPFTLLAVAGVSLALDRRTSAAALVVGYLPLVRHEGLLFSGLLGAYLLARRRWLELSLLALPECAYNLLTYALRGHWPLAVYLEPTRLLGFWGSGGWLYYALPLWTAVGWPIGLLGLAGLAGLHARPRRVVVAALAGIHLASQVVMFRFGLFESGGWTRYLLPVAPFVAVFAVLGLQACLELGERIRWPRGLTLAIGLVPVVLVGLTARPYRVDGEQRALGEVAQWITRSGTDPGLVEGSHVWLYYDLDLPARPGHSWSYRPPLETFGPGTLVVWDDHYSEMWGLPLAVLGDPRSGWEPVYESGDGFARVFRKACSEPTGAPCPKGS